jgi:hypothetical protein
MAMPDGGTDGLMSRIPNGLGETDDDSAALSDSDDGSAA